MTARWARAAAGDGSGKERGTVLAAAGVWPLLAMLAGPAHGPARAELAAALGVPAESAAAAGREVLAALDAAPGVRTAVGLWARRMLELRPEWRAELPLDTHGELTGDVEADLAELNAWAARRTEGMIDKMPPVIGRDTLFVLASALVARTTWAWPFTETLLDPQAGPWSGRRLAGLVRFGPLGDLLAVHGTRCGLLTRLRVEGDEGLDVHLLLGPEERSAGEVLEAGIATLGGACPTTYGDELPEGGAVAPGVTVTTVPSRDTEPTLAVRSVAFTVDAEHDLLDHAALFGLESARNAVHGHFPGISAYPLAVSAARQSATATFGSLGFRAAAVTAVAAAPGGAPMPPSHRARQVEARFDRPFGFLAVQRATGLVIAAGWVADPGTR
ncbi:serpin family protein [Streptomyces ochraceiscleroticus]|uniref:Serpin family protein n=1 Tax=Streptomyces ochraceiscleroticus TaxID=47761 RepID=A0ABW1MQX6_9ACTN|nr:serpin family protein [Streptomyces ochraceiscleroticus]